MSKISKSLQYLEKYSNIDIKQAFHLSPPTRRRLIDLFDPVWLQQIESDKWPELKHTALNFLHEYGMVSRILEDVSRIEPSFYPKTTLSILTKARPDFFAIQRAFPEAHDFCFIEENNEFINIVKRIVDPETTANIRVRPNLTQLKLNETFDLIVATSEQANHFEKVLDLLSPNGIAILFDTSHEPIQAVRQSLIEKDILGNFNIIAPCTHNLMCPFARFSQMKGRKVSKEGTKNFSVNYANTGSCFFTQRTENLVASTRYSTRIGKMTSVKDMKTSKFSYLAIKNGEREDKKELGRAVRPTQRPKQQVVLDLCHDGEIDRVSLGKQRFKSRGLGEVYKVAKKATHGGVWPLEMTPAKLGEKVKQNSVV